jgi:hypothetical protein
LERKRILADATKSKIWKLDQFELLFVTSQMPSQERSRERLGTQTEEE